MQKIINLDSDGTLFDWNGAVISTLEKLNIPNINRAQLIEQLKQGKRLKHLVPELYDILEEHTDDFWQNIEPFYWTQNLFDLASQYGEVVILTSAGNEQSPYYKNTVKGKSTSIPRYFPETQIIVCENKFEYANPKTILVDDTKTKVQSFQEAGGFGFIWPNQYKLIDNEVNIHQTLGELERKLEELVSN